MTAKPMIFLCVAALWGSTPLCAAESAKDAVKLNQIQLIGTHNS